MPEEAFITRSIVCITETDKGIEKGKAERRKRHRNEYPAFNAISRSLSSCVVSPRICDRQGGLTGFVTAALLKPWPQEGNAGSKPAVF
jgi:hypothetical protein